MDCVCPDCHGPLRYAKTQAECPACRHTWPVLDGIPRFMTVDPKYNTPPVPWDQGGSDWKLPFADAGVTWFFSKYLPVGGRVLDIGCGVGLRYIAGRAGAVYGIDSAVSQLAHARTIYHEVAVANVLAIPYSDNFFDAAISVDVFEHIPIEFKNRAITEMIRVVKPGGRLVHILDLDSQKPLYRWAKRRPALWQKYFIDQMGHYGLETATAALDRFRGFDLLPLAEEATNRTVLQHPGNYAWQFDNEYARSNVWVRVLTSLSYFIRRHLVLHRAYSGFYQLVWTRTFERFFPRDWAFNLAVAYEVRKKSL